MALLIAYAAASILIAEELPRGDLRSFLSTTHRTAGAIVLVLFTARVVWRLFHKPPPLPSTMTPLQQKMAHFGHLGLYGLMALVPIVGVALTFRRGGTIDFGLFQIASPLVADRAASKPIKEIHELVAYALFALVGVHVAAALWHQFVVRDNILERMR
jgi:cytochrome b561